MEEVPVVLRREALEEARERGREPIVRLVAGRPEGVAADVGEGVELEDGVVGGDGLEGDVRVPTDACALVLAEACARDAPEDAFRVRREVPVRGQL